MIVTTTEHVAGRTMSESIGVCRGNVIRARHVGNDIIAGLRNIGGGEVNEYTKLMAEARQQSYDRMVKHAEQMGADAIVGMRFTTSTITNGAAEILAFGTAVKLSADGASDRKSYMQRAK